MFEVRHHVADFLFASAFLIMPKGPARTLLLVKFQEFAEIVSEGVFEYEFQELVNHAPELAKKIGELSDEEFEELRNRFKDAVIEGTSNPLNVFPDYVDHQEDGEP